MRIALVVYSILLAAIVALASAGGIIVLGGSGAGGTLAALADRYAYNVAQWELRHLGGKLLYTIGHLLDGGSDRQADDALLSRYYRLVSEIGELERQASSLTSSQLQQRLSALRQERQGLENRVESILEGRIADLLMKEGLAINPPLFSGIDLIFPPPDFELDRPPQVLAVSPRARIHLDSVYLLRPGLGLDQVVGVEAEAEATGVSAIVVTTGGVSTYPSIVPDLSTYESTVETAIHEWLHQYLALHPLGRRYFVSNDLRTLNETVANMAAADLSRLLLGQSAATSAQPSAPASEEAFDFRKEMRALRLQVEELLADGQIEEAEGLMEEKRRLFAEKGYYIRRINQAYFAYYGSYADTPASIDPIGPKLQALRQRLGSVGEFVRTAARFTSVDDLDRALAELTLTDRQ